MQYQYTSVFILPGKLGNTRQNTPAKTQNLSSKPLATWHTLSLASFTRQMGIHPEISPL